MSVVINGTTGIELPTTSAQFDNDVSAASTAFVQRALGNFSDNIFISTPTQLLASHVGSYIASSANLTLPDGTTCIPGNIITITGSGSNIVVSPFGTDLLQTNAGTIVSNITIPSLTSIRFRCTGANGWYVLADDASLEYSPLFSLLENTNGYQKLPSGLIIQWGAGSTTSGTGSITFPIAFPNACLHFSAQYGGASGISNVPICANSIPSTTGCNIYMTDHAGTGLGTVGGYKWVALGY